MSDCPANTCWTKSAPWRMGLYWALTTSEISGRMILYFKKRIRDGGGWSDWKAFRGGCFSSLSSSFLDRSSAAAFFPHLNPLYVLSSCAHRRSKDGEPDVAKAGGGGFFQAYAERRMCHAGRRQGAIRAGPSDSTVQWDDFSELGRRQGTYHLTEGWGLTWGSTFGHLLVLEQLSVGSSDLNRLPQLIVYIQTQAWWNNKNANQTKPSGFLLFHLMNGRLWHMSH